MDFKNIIAKAKDFAGKNPDKVRDGIDKAEAVVNEKTGGKYSDKIQQGQEKAKDALDGLDGENDDITDSGPISGPQTHDPRE